MRRFRRRVNRRIWYPCTERYRRAIATSFRRSFLSMTDGKTGERDLARNSQQIHHNYRGALLSNSTRKITKDFLARRKDGISEKVMFDYLDGEHVSMFVETDTYRKTSFLAVGVDIPAKRFPNLTLIFHLDFIQPIDCPRNKTAVVIFLVHPGVFGKPDRKPRRENRSGKQSHLWKITRRDRTCGNDKIR